MILLMSDYQMKYRYYTKVIESIKEKSFSGMGNKEFLNLFEKKKFSQGQIYILFIYNKNKNFK